MIGVLFVMIINPSISSIPFASIQDLSNNKDEAEVLFSMHTVFRVNEITATNKNNTLYQVNLTLTADGDPELCILTDLTQKEVGDGTGWQPLGLLLFKLNQLDKAEGLHNIMIQQASNQGEKAIHYTHLGLIKERQSDYKSAIDYYEKGLQIRQETVREDHPSLAISYNNIDLVYNNIGECSKALSFHEKALQIRQKSLRSDDLSLATSYNNVGSVYDRIGEYSKALSFHEKALEIRQKNSFYKSS